MSPIYLTFVIFATQKNIMSNKNQFYELKVKDVTTETAEAVSVSFSIPAEHEELYEYKAGQYLTLRFEIDGKDVRRAYSMSSSPLDNKTTVTVKRVKDGLVSNYMNSSLKGGMSIKVMPPQGKFTTDFSADKQRDFYLFGGGSGITPLMSILKTVLEKEPKSTVNLFYGNQDENNIIFRSELDQLEKKYQGQLNIEHILADPIREKPAGLTSFLKKGKITWPGKVGVPDSAHTNAFLDTHPPRSKESIYFICGPGPMMDSVESVLLKRGIDAKAIQIERFSSTPPQDQKAGAAATTGVGGPAKLKVTLDGKVIETTVSEGKTILDTLLDMKIEPPYSCTSGSCSTCMAKVLSGTTKMDACYALDDDEIEDGFILTCQAHPTSAEVEINFDI